MKDAVGAIAVALIVLLIVNHVARLAQAVLLHRTVRDALEHNNAVGSQLLEWLGEPKSLFGGDDRIGLILVALGAAMIAFGLFQPDAEIRSNVVPASAFPLLVGLVLIGRYLAVRRKEHQADG